MLIRRIRQGEIQRIVKGTTGVEWRSAGRAVVSFHVGTNTHFVTANTAEDGDGVHGFHWPGSGRMISQFPVTVDAGVIRLAADHFYGHHIERAVIVAATGG